MGISKYVATLYIGQKLYLGVIKMEKGEPEYWIVETLNDKGEVIAKKRNRVYYCYGRGYIVKNGVRYFLSEFQYNK